MDLFSWRYSVVSYIVAVVLISIILIIDSIFTNLPSLLVEKLQYTRASYIMYWKEVLIWTFAIAIVLWVLYRYKSSFQFYLMQKKRAYQRERSAMRGLHFSIHKE